VPTWCPPWHEVFRNGPRKKLTKRSVDAAQPRAARYEIYDPELKGFVLRVETSGVKTFAIRYRAGRNGRTAPKRFLIIGRYGPLTPDEARKRARELLGAVAKGDDPARQRDENRAAMSLKELADAFMAEHVEPKRKLNTLSHYRILLRKHVLPDLGHRRAHEITRAEMARLHHKMRDRPFVANRVLAVVAAMYAWGGKVGYVPESITPASRIERYREQGRERYLTTHELMRLGEAIRIAETVGATWAPNPMKKTKHAPKEENRRVRISPYAAAAIRLLILTGARLREILHLQWDQVDFERGVLWLPDTKSGKKVLVLGAAALHVMAEVPRAGRYVIASDDPGRPRRDLKRPWDVVTKLADLNGVRLHDLRHSFASVGVSGGMGLPIVGALLGHTQQRTTAKYAHLANDATRRAADTISGTIAAALAPERQPAAIAPLRLKRGHGNA
jgi:integrase